MCYRPVHLCAFCDRPRDWTAPRCSRGCGVHMESLCHHHLMRRLRLGVWPKCRRCGKRARLHQVTPGLFWESFAPAGKRGARMTLDELAAEWIARFHAEGDHERAHLLELQMAAQGEADARLTGVGA